uniref:Testis expressed 50 n=1 Tax=Vombatus ursinus TaxID=29139 RepID=A0A4X2K5Y5_VOMUR
MFIQGLSLVIPLWSVCFVKESFCICARTTWAKVGWEIFPGEVDLMQLTPPHSCWPYPLDQLGCNFWNCAKLSYILVETLFIILTVLSGHYLWTQWKTHTRKPEDIFPSNVDQQNQSIYDIDQMLCRLISTTSMLTRYLKQVSHHPSKKLKHRRKFKKKRDGDRPDWNFQMCSHVN